MIKWFCVGFILGNVFNWLMQWWRGRKMYLKYRSILEPVVMQVFEEEEREKDE